MRILKMRRVAVRQAGFFAAGAIRVQRARFYLGSPSRPWSFFFLLGRRSTLFEAKASVWLLPHKFFFRLSFWALALPLVSPKLSERV
jgi:hypothetical protein